MEKLESSKPFTRAEVRALIQAADQMTYTRRDRSDDPRFYGRLLRVFLTFGPHPKVVPLWSSAENLAVRPTERGDRTYFSWVRAKAEQTTRPNIEIEVPGPFVSWLGGWLDAPKPTSGWAYWTFFKKIEAETLRTTGYTIQANPRRARHTCAQQMLERGFTAVDVMNAIGVDAHTLQTYGESTPEQRGEKGEKVGWGNWE
jgi:integrase